MPHRKRKLSPGARVSRLFLHAGHTRHAAIEWETGKLGQSIVHDLHRSTLHEENTSSMFAGQFKCTIHQQQVT